MCVFDDFFCEICAFCQNNGQKRRFELLLSYLTAQKLVSSSKHSSEAQNVSLEVQTTSFVLKQHVWLPKRTFRQDHFLCKFLKREPETPIFGSLYPKTLHIQPWSHLFEPSRDFLLFFTPNSGTSAKVISQMARLDEITITKLVIQKAWILLQ